MNDLTGTMVTVSVAILGCVGVVTLWPSPFASLLAGAALFLGGAFFIDIAFDRPTSESPSRDLVDPGVSRLADSDYETA